MVWPQFCLSPNIIFLFFFVALSTCQYFAFSRHSVLVSILFFWVLNSLFSTSCYKSNHPLSVGPQSLPNSQGSWQLHDLSYYFSWLLSFPLELGIPPVSSNSINSTISFPGTTKKPNKPLTGSHLSIIMSYQLPSPTNFLTVAVIMFLILFANISYLWVRTLIISHVNSMIACLHPILNLNVRGTCTCMYVCVCLFVKKNFN